MSVKRIQDLEIRYRILIRIKKRTTFCLKKGQDLKASTTHLHPSLPWVPPPPHPAIAKLRRPWSLALSIVSEGQSIVLVNMTFCCGTPLLKIICERTCNNNLTCCCCCRWMVECFVLFGIFLVIRSSLDPTFCGIFGWELVGTQQNFIRGGSAPRGPTPLPLLTLFLNEKVFRVPQYTI